LLGGEALAFKDFMNHIGHYFSNDKKRMVQQAKFLDGYSPIFSQFGENVYASDIVQMAIDVIATEISKLQPKHIRIDKNGVQKVVTSSSINRLFKFAPNELMTTRDFLEKVVWQLFLNYNAFIYPTYLDLQDSKGKPFRRYTGFYPLNPKQVVFLQDETGQLFVELGFANGDKYTFPYDSVIHLRKKFSVNDVMGGGMNGQPDNQALLKTLKLNDMVLQTLPKALMSSLSIKGIMKINTMVDGETQEKERAKFEKQIKQGEAGILITDVKSDYQDIKPDPKIIDKDTMEFIENKILRYFGVPIPVLNGDYTDTQYQAFYEKTLEPMVLGLKQAFTKTLFTGRELDTGNEIAFYQKDMMYLNTSAKLNLLKTAGEQGLLSDNQKLALLGYSPIPGGDRRTISLNFIDTDIATAYQMQQAKKGGKPNGQENTD